MDTLYQFGRTEILRLIEEYLELLEATDSLTTTSDEVFEHELWRIFLLCGRGVSHSEMPETAAECRALYESRARIDHDLQSAVSGPLYAAMRQYAKELTEEARKRSNDFRDVDEDWLYESPELLPVLLHAAGTFSKAVLAREVGQVSDSGVSRPAARRLEAFFEKRFTGDAPSSEQLVERMGSTIEGQVRDLLGRYLLEALVEAALIRSDVPFVRESEYDALAGVVYDHRADFVIPDASSPLLFVEVRKSSARHSSLYAKDKMFSAINWKGRHPDLVGVLVADGEWSRHSLLALAKVFDYVLPVNSADDLARVARAYVDGDRSVLRRIIHFAIEEPNGSRGALN